MEPLLDFEPLLKPISDESPSGPPADYEILQKLRELRKEDPEFGRKSDWPGIVREATETLQKKSKDLDVAILLVEALVKMQEDRADDTSSGFAGVRDGLQLLLELVEKCWDRINPPIEELENRAGCFEWLDDPDKGACFPSTLKLLSLVVGPKHKFGYLDWERIQKGQGDKIREDYTDALKATTPERANVQFQEVVKSLANLNELRKALVQKMDKKAPAMNRLLETLQEICKLAGAIREEKCPASPPNGNKLLGQDSGSSIEVIENGASPATRRADAYRKLALIADELERLEPHSPIPYLIRRAIKLGENRKFPDLLRELRGAPVLIDWVMGTDEPAEPAPSE
jgi:type VI secretion system protein ImpA